MESEGKTDRQLNKGTIKLETSLLFFVFLGDVFNPIKLFNSF